MKKKLFASLAASVLCASACTLTASARNWSFTDDELSSWTPLDDKGMFSEEGRYHDYVVYAPDTVDMTSVYSPFDYKRIPLYRMNTAGQYYEFVLKPGTTATEGAEILNYLLDEYAYDFMDIDVVKTEAGTTFRVKDYDGYANADAVKERVRSVFRDLAEMDVITAFYENASSSSATEFIVTGGLTTYLPYKSRYVIEGGIGEFVHDPLDMEAIQCYLEEVHPDCRIEWNTDRDIFTVVSENEQTLADYFELAADLYEQFGLVVGAFTNESAPTHFENKSKNLLDFPGDINNDLAVDVRDAVILSRIIAEDTALTVTDAGLLNADTNGDGLITLSDLTALLTVLANPE